MEHQLPAPPLPVSFNFWRGAVGWVVGRPSFLAARMSSSASVLSFVPVCQPSALGKGQLRRVCGPRRSCDEEQLSVRRLMHSSTVSGQDVETANLEGVSKNSSANRGEANQARREKMKALWKDPVWREKVLARRRSQKAVKKQAKQMAERWADHAYRQKVVESLKGRKAWNSGVPLSEETKSKISVSLRGVPKSAETRQKMSLAKFSKPLSSSWCENITRGKQGKTREFFSMRKEYNALVNDLRLWSDSYRVRTGGTPRAEVVDKLVIMPALLVKLKRYLYLKGKLQEFDPIYEHDDPIFRSQRPKPKG